MGVAKIGEGGRLVVVVTHFLVQLEGPPVVGDGLGMPAEPVVDVAGAVQAGRLPVAVVEFPLQGKGLKAGGGGLPVFAEQRLQPADSRGSGSTVVVDNRFRTATVPIRQPRAFGGPANPHPSEC